MLTILTSMSHGEVLVVRGPDRRSWGDLSPQGLSAYGFANGRSGMVISRCGAVAFCVSPPYIQAHTDCAIIEVKGNRRK
jgi:hypothetical protein